MLPRTEKMGENRFFNKMAKLRCNADKNHAMATMYLQRNKPKKAGKFEGKAQHFEMKLRQICDKLTLVSVKLKEKETKLRAYGKNYKAEKMALRIAKINQRLQETLKQSNEASTSTKEVYREMQIVKEVVRVPCKFCGTYVDHTEAKCPGCGGSLKF